MSYDSSTEIQAYVMKARDLFEDVQSTEGSTSYTRAGQQSILNYEKILDDMMMYLKGYQKYHESKNNSYRHKVIQQTYTFYNNMFKDPKYRKKIALSNFPQNNYKFIQKSKELNTVIKNMKRSVDNETLNLARVTENQYKKIAKVNKDDMNIYLWLHKGQSVSSELRSFYGDRTTPVMHKSTN